MDCLICKSNSREQRLSPAPPIWQGRYWRVEHAYPCSQVGWLVVVLERHAETLHQLTKAEWDEFSRILPTAIQTLREVLGSTQEYVRSLVGLPGFHHVHYHIIPKTTDLSNDVWAKVIAGPVIGTVEDAVAADQVQSFCDKAREYLAAKLPSISPVVPFTIMADPKPSEEDSGILLKGLNVHAWLARRQDLMESWAFFVRNESGKVVAGAKGITFYGCLYTDLLWVDSALRGQGWGSKLMASAEDCGRQRGCTFATVNTMDWEALPFYQKLGYTIEFVREGFRFNSRLFFLRKAL